MFEWQPKMSLIHQPERRKSPSVLYTQISVIRGSSLLSDCKAKLWFWQVVKHKQKCYPLSSMVAIGIGCKSLIHGPISTKFQMLKEYYMMLPKNVHQSRNISQKCIALLTCTTTNGSLSACTSFGTLYTYTCSPAVHNALQLNIV